MADPSLSATILIISWNQRDFLVRLVEQCLDQEFDPRDYEVIVVDDGSTDGSQEWLNEQTDPRLRPLLSNDRVGRAASRNRGILAARGRVVIMIDGDHTIQRDFIRRHLELHESQACAVVGKSDFVDHPDFRALNHYLNGGGAVKLPPGSTLPGRYFLTRNCSVPRDVLLKIGMFDEDFTAWGGEDLELGVKLEEAGVPILACPEALAVHHHLRPLDALLENLYRYGREGIPILVDRHPRLYRELNLDRLTDHPSERGRYHPLSRLGYRILILAPVYRVIKSVAVLLRRRRLPRFVFDYLHLRQYGRGYLDHLKSQP